MLPLLPKREKVPNYSKESVLLDVDDDITAIRKDGFYDTNNIATAQNWINNVDQYDDTKQCNSIYLLVPSNIDESIRYPDAEATKCKLSECECFKRIQNVLFKYNQFIIAHHQQQQQQTMNYNMHDIYETDYNNTHLLNDFNHLLFHHLHQHDHEEIHDILLRKCYDNNSCDISKCTLIRRNYRDRFNIFDKKLYFEAEDEEIIIQQLLDRIHCYYLHSFDIGHKFNKKEVIQICTQQMEEKKSEDSILNVDIIGSEIHNIIHHKRERVKVIRDLGRVLNQNEKFIINQPPSKADDADVYSYGHRFDYVEHPVENFVYHYPEKPASGWNIKRKYETLKEELTQNEMCFIDNILWNHLCAKSEAHKQTIYVRKIICPRRQNEYDIKQGDTLNIDHLSSIMAYSNYDVLSAKFSETYRKLTEDESNEALKKRHSNYYWMGRKLREIIECFGMSWVQDKIYFTRLYHGIRNEFVFPSLHAFIKGPLSTTLDYAVAVNFCEPQGMILEMIMDKEAWQFHYMDYQPSTFESYFRRNLYCFDFAAFSDFVSEQEIFFIGGARRFLFRNITEVPSGVNYTRYIEGIMQMTYCMDNKMYHAFNRYSKNKPIEKANTKNQRQMVWRLLSRELHRSLPEHPLAFEFKSIPKKIDCILHEHCERIASIRLHENNEMECNVLNAMFKYDNGWIKLNMIGHIFPNTKNVIYEMPWNLKNDKDIEPQLSKICESVFNFLSDESCNLKKIQIIKIETLSGPTAKTERMVREWKNAFNDIGFAIKSNWRFTKATKEQSSILIWDLFFIRFDALSIFRASQFRPDSEPIGYLRICGCWCDTIGLIINVGFFLIAVLLILFGIVINGSSKVSSDDLKWINAVIACVLLCVIGAFCYWNFFRNRSHRTALFDFSEHESKGPHEVEELANAVVSLQRIQKSS